MVHCAMYGGVVLGGFFFSRIDGVDIDFSQTHGDFYYSTAIFPKPKATFTRQFSILFYSANQ